MSELDPLTTTVGDICLAAIRESGRLGVGQNAIQEDITAAWARLQWMLQEWQRKRFLIYALQNYGVVATGALSYTVGPGGQIDTGVRTMRPDKIESAFLRQLTQTQPNQPDYYLQILQAKEDYNRIMLKELSSFPSYAFYDPQWPLGLLYPWPVAQASIYQVFIAVKIPMPTNFPSLATIFSVPFEQYNAMLYNLAVRMRSYYGMLTQQGDLLPGLAKDSLNAVRGANTAIARLQMPREIPQGSGRYNVYTDQTN